MPPYPIRPFPASSGPPSSTLTFQPDSPGPGPGPVLSEKPAVMPECPLVVMACTAHCDSNLESREPHLDVPGGKET